jgi:hypothetical protein
MNRERAMAIFIGVIMVLSMAGFAMNSSTITTSQGQTPQISNIVEKPLTPEETVFVLRTGRIIIRDYYAEEPAYMNVLTSLAGKFERYIVLEKVKVESNQTSKFEIIGKTGEIKDLGNYTITEESAMDLFCEYAILQPKECLLRSM